MVLNCQILFPNNPNLLFYSGQTVTGKIEVDVDEKPVKVQRLCLKIEGFSQCQWTEIGKRQPSSSGILHRSYVGHEKYLDSLSYPVDDLIVFTPGKHNYNFTFTIPKEAPTSIEEKEGRIRYTITVILERPWKFDLKQSLGITVINPVDLNREFQQLSSPYTKEKIKTFCCLFCGSKPLIMRVKAPMTGFVAGQTVNLVTEVINPTTTEFKGLKITFNKIVTYQSDFPHSNTKFSSSVLFEEFCVGSVKNNTKIYEKQLKIPLVPPNTLGKSKVIDVSYNIQVEGKVSGFHKNIVTTVPVVIGTVPFYETIQQNVQPSAPVFDLQTAQTGFSEGGQMHLPTYEEAMPKIEINGGENKLHLINGRHSTYCPVYPLYNIQQPIGPIGFNVPMSSSPYNYNMTVKI